MRRQLNPSPSSGFALADLSPSARGEGIKRARELRRRSGIGDACSRILAASSCTGRVCR